MCPLGSGKTALRFPIHGNFYVATGNSIKPRWEIKTIIKRVETYLASWVGKNIDKNKQKLQKSIVLTYMTTHRISWEFNMNPGYFSLVVNTLKPQHSLGYLPIYPPQIATVMKPISFCSMHIPVSHTKSLGESREWNMVFQCNIWYRLKAF